MGRKDPRNFGDSTAEQKLTGDAPAYRVPAGRYSIVLPERVILALLRTEIEWLADSGNSELLTRFFSHFFDPVITEKERKSYVSNFQRQPPQVVLGYPRTTVEFPAIAIVMERDRMAEEALGKYLGQTQAGDPIEEPEEYVGSMFEQTYGLFIYAKHPDLCLYVYHLVKGIMLGAHAVLQECGIIDPQYEGGEFIPQPDYMPENMFVRRLGVTLRTLHTVPVVLTPNPDRLKVTGIWVDDIVVSGIRGGVHPIDPTSEE